MDFSCYWVSLMLPLELNLVFDQKTSDPCFCYTFPSLAKWKPNLGHTCLIQGWLRHVYHAGLGSFTVKKTPFRAYSHLIHSRVLCNNSGGTQKYQKKSTHRNFPLFLGPMRIRCSDSSREILPWNHGIFSWAVVAINFSSWGFWLMIACSRACP